MIYKWKVEPEPTGLHRSFYRRGWPKAYYSNADERIAAMIKCPDEYTPRNVKAGQHGPLTLHVADYSGEKSFEWRRAKGEYATLAAAKEALVRILEKNPGILPEDLRK